MVARVSLETVDKKKPGGNYFAAPKTQLEFIPTGCRVLDLALGGGWAEGRIGNIVGDKSTGKTLLCIEAASNFVLKYPNSVVHYREVEAAFDDAYAEALGMPMDQVEFGSGEIDTVEAMFADLRAVIAKTKRPTLYIVDSLDALSDEAEMDRDMDAASYGAEKAKKLSQLFRRLTRDMGAANVTLLIVSQVRSKIGMTFGGRTTTRSGGRALDFYASQVLFLSQIGTLSRTIAGVKRPVGITVRGKVDKNKISLPFREAEFQIVFGYGIDDVQASLTWLKEVKSLKETGVSAEQIKTFSRNLMNAATIAEVWFEAERINDIVERRWFEVEKSFLPKRKKYA